MNVDRKLALFRIVNTKVMSDMTLIVNPRDLTFLVNKKKYVYVMKKTD